MKAKQKYKQHVVLDVKGRIPEEFKGKFLMFDKNAEAIVYRESVKLTQAEKDENKAKRAAINQVKRDERAKAYKADKAAFDKALAKLRGDMRVAKKSMTKNKDASNAYFMLKGELDQLLARRPKKPSFIKTGKAKKQ